MIDVFISLSLLGYCLFARRVSRLCMEAIPLLVVAGTTIALYIAAYFYVLRVCGAGLIVFGELLLITAPIYLRTVKHDLWTDYFTPGFVIFIGFLIILGLLTQDIFILGGDELARWAPHAKYIIQNHQLWTATDGVLNDRNYPPAAALFYYYFSQWGHYADSRFHFAQLYFLLTPTLIFLRRYRWTNFLDTLIIYVGILLVLVLFFQLQLPPKGSL